jgi:two-component system chemotaxis response regulator CheB
MLAQALAPERDIEVVGQAPNAYVARDKVLELDPDVLTLDIEMPGMDGITFLRKLMQYKPIPVIVISSLGQSACQASMEALRAGAVEILAKPHGPYSIGELGQTLAAKIRIAAVANVRAVAAATQPAPVAIPLQPMAPLPEVPIRSTASFATCRVIAIGASTGGPGAVAELLRALPANMPPILIVQHMPAVFTRHFAERLDRECAVSVKEAEDGDELLPGRVLIAPGDFHMALRGGSARDRVWVGTGPAVCFSRPSVDVLFASIAESVGKKAVGVLLTGMGGDGARSLLAMRQAGAFTVAQSEASCVVFGMPREAIRLDAATAVLPLDRIAPTLLTYLDPAASKRA